MSRKATIGTVAAVLLAASSMRAALAISTLEDTLRELPRITRSPSSVPPNNAVHRNLGNRSNGGGELPDEGPDDQTMPNTLPASSFPFTTALSESPQLAKDFLCAGTLVAPNWVLTAAHCTYNISRRWPNDVSAFAFTATANLESPGPRFNVTQIVVHPDYDPRTLKNDVALLKIDAKGAAAGLPIRLEGPPAGQLPGEIMSILGWGISSGPITSQHRDRLQILQAAIVDSGVCFSSLAFPRLRGTGVYCARTLLKFHDVCFRFGGSPIVLFDREGRLYLVGLVSWPAKCPNVGRKPNVYLDVQAYVPWIKSVIDAQK